VAVLHRGHIHNHTALRSQLQDRGYHFSTDSDGELIAHLIDAVHPGDALQAVRRAAALLQGPGAFAVQFHDQSHRLLATRVGPSVALRLHPQRAELVVPAPLSNASTGNPMGIYLLPEGDVLDIDTTL
jgi:glucosamine--fructose-6-phosphate aminotransferase (isomerizing)